MGGQISSDARVGEERRRLDSQTLNFWRNGGDRIRVVQRIQPEAPGVAAYLVKLITAIGSGTEGVWYRCGATFGTMSGAESDSRAR